MNYYTSEELRSLPYDLFLSTHYWRQVKEAVFERDGRQCTCCGSDEHLEAHHKTYENRGDELSHLDDLTTLCSFCHSVIHKKPIVERRGSGEIVLTSKSAPASFERIVLLSEQKAWEWL